MSQPSVSWLSPASGRPSPGETREAGPGVTASGDTGLLGHGSDADLVHHTEYQCNLLLTVIACVGIVVTDNILNIK